jgi:2-C-methyl-D-erythritol 4-phosphate cytidylyltransferase/2-C-methyl-D-erythritol 2,4-cyclodiphosphate synthase
VTAFDAVIVAAGESRRMAGRDKVWALVAGRPLLAWTIGVIASAPGLVRLAVVVAPDRVVELARADWLPAAVVAVVAGGSRRQESVAAGVRALAPGPGDDVLLVHDGARPLVTPDLVTRVAAAAAATGAAIPVVPVAETVKRVEAGRIAATIDRRPLALAQTPQGVRRSILAAAWQQYPPEGPETWTDEAALLEACRIPVDAIRGEPANLKVTLPDDLARAEAVLGGRRGRPFGRGGDGAIGADLPGPRRAPAEQLLVGLGEDSHPFGPGEPLRLGGLSLSGAPRLHGHSDGDVALHAIGTALLGVAGLGDLGRLFPAGPDTQAGIASTELLIEVRRRVVAAGLAPRWVDLTITGSRPRLADRLPAMAAAIAALLEIPVAQVSVKASTGNLAGMEGAGRGISARAIVIVGPVGAGPVSQPGLAEAPTAGHAGRLPAGEGGETAR